MRTCTVDPQGKIQWHLGGKSNRENGPAVIRPNGYMEWRLNGEKVPPPGEKP